jgi:hypothetical protein
MYSKKNFLMRKYLLTFLLIAGTLVSAQTDDPFDVLGDWEEAETDALITFRSTKVVNMPSVEIPHTGELIFNIGHRFGNVRTGIYDMFGLDIATIRLGFDYGINSWLGAGIGRSTFEKTYDAYLKARILTQDAMARSPISLSYYISASQATLRHHYPAGQDNFSGRLSVIQSLMIARKFSDKFSIQAGPVWLHSNFLTETQGSADKVSLGLASRIRLTPITHLNLEYIHEIIDDGVENTNPLSVGFDIETGGHVFQLFFSNTQGIFDKAYLVNTRGRWGDGDIYFGFTITRVFYL